MLALMIKFEGIASNLRRKKRGGCKKSGGRTAGYDVCEERTQPPRMWSLVGNSGMGDGRASGGPDVLGVGGPAACPQCTTPSLRDVHACLGTYVLQCRSLYTHAYGQLRVSLMVCRMVNVTLPTHRSSDSACRESRVGLFRKPQLAQLPGASPHVIVVTVIPLKRACSNGIAVSSGGGALANATCSCAHYWATLCGSYRDQGSLA